MSQRQELCAATAHPKRRLYVDAEIGHSRRAQKALIDKKATINAISTTTARELEMKSCELEKPYTFGTVAARNAVKVTRRTLPLTVRIQGHEKELVFDIVDLAGYDVILGDPWLEKHNSTIN